MPQHSPGNFREADGEAAAILISTCFRSMLARIKLTKPQKRFFVQCCRFHAVSAVPHNALLLIVSAFIALRQCNRFFLPFVAVRVLEAVKGLLAESLVELGFL